jgi:hypothetical protein
VGYVSLHSLDIVPIAECVDSLVYHDDIKPKLLNYIYATLLLSDANVDCTVSPLVQTRLLAHYF